MGPLGVYEAKAFVLNRRSRDSVVATRVPWMNTDATTALECQLAESLTLVRRPGHRPGTFNTTARTPMAHPLVRFVCFCALGAMIYAACRKYVVEAVPLAMLVWGAAGAKHFSRDLVDLIPAIKRAGERAALEKWGGRYYVFDGSQIRFCLIDGTVWVVEADVRKFIVPPVTAREKRLLGVHHAIIPGIKQFGYSEHGLLRLLTVRLQRRGGERESIKFLSWLRSEAIPNVKRLPTSSCT
jgi:hypothetical protein